MLSMNNLILLSWNVRGTCNIGSKRMIKDTLRANKINFLCLQETKCGKWNNNMMGSLWDVDNHGWIESEGIGQAGGLLCSWDLSEFKLVKAEVNERWIWCHMLCQEKKREFHIVNVYSAQELNDKRRLWSELSQINTTLANVPCCFIGDFNSIRNNDERLNCTYRRVDMEEFNDFIKKNNLMDLDFQNSQFSWFGQTIRRTN